MLQQPEPDDYVVATGEAHAVRDFLEAAFGTLDLDWREHVFVDPRYIRPAEVDHLQGDASRAREKLGWRAKVGFGELVRMMVDHDLDLAHQEKTLREAGHDIFLRGVRSGHG